MRNKEVAPQSERPEEPHKIIARQLFEILNQSRITMEECEYLARFRPGDATGFLNGSVSITTIAADLQQDMSVRYPVRGKKPYAGLYPLDFDD